MEEAEYWIDEMVGEGLGKLTYFHVHSDGSRFPTQVETPEGGWVSIPGQYDQRVKVVCLRCGKKLQPTDRIKFQ